MTMQIHLAEPGAGESPTAFERAAMAAMVADINARLAEGMGGRDLARAVLTAYVVLAAACDEKDGSIASAFWNLIASAGQIRPQELAYLPLVAPSAEVNPARLAADQEQAADAAMQLASSTMRMADMTEIQMAWVHAAAVAGLLSVAAGDVSRDVDALPVYKALLSCVGIWMSRRGPDLVFADAVVRARKAGHAGALQEGTRPC
ncbi:MAG: hypothetical protein H7841_08425 [Magnetospirillum sp. WYHS-4]